MPNFQKLVDCSLACHLLVLLLTILVVVSFLYNCMVLLIMFNFFLSLSYGGGHPSHSETDLLHRQTYTASHQLPGYSATHHPTGNCVNFFSHNIVT